MKRYKEKILEGIPPQEQGDTVAAGFLVALVGTPGNSFSSTAAESGALNYMRKGIRLYEIRWRRPEPLYAKT
jgi:hypothetical protein